MTKLTEILAKELNQKTEHIENVVKLLDEGNTIPFIARYRKEMHGAMDDTALRTLETRLLYLRGLKERKEEVLRLIEEQGKLTPELKSQIEAAEVMQRVEDLYKPFKQKRATRASKAKERGLEPLAMLMLLQRETKGSPADFAKKYVNPELEVTSPEEALQGACDIIAEGIADDADLTASLREKAFQKAVLDTQEGEPDEKKTYEMYYERAEKVSKIPNHRVLAINRGEKEKKLKVKVEMDAAQFLPVLERHTIRNRSCIFVPLLEATAEDAWKRLIAPSLEREIRSALTERAQEDAIRVFAKNTESLLMVPPVKNVKVISIDPGYRTGCKVAVLDETGKLLDYTTIYPTPPKKDIDGTKKTLRKLTETHGCDVIVIGNGTASRETEEVVADFIRETGLPLQYTIVNEAGASVYSASELAAKEYPDLDVTTRGAMSLGRRLQDPLAELVKIEPQHIGVGQYQHDLNQKALAEALGAVVETCVNRVGVDLNTASPSLLSYVAGINAVIAKNIVAYREENGRFTTRRELLKVPRLGPKAYEQCAGFLRISDGKEPLDATAVHPETYAATKELMKKIGVDPVQAISVSRASMGVRDLEDRIQKAWPEKSPKESIQLLAEELGIGRMTLEDIISELKKPGRDPREDAPPVIFRSDVRSFEDLKEGMELSGTVRNVVDFGAFVDIGVKQDGLVHISKLSKKFVKHPSDVVAVGDTVKVTIIGIDPVKKKISLSMVE